jgi:uncharacterized protein (TIGR02271 family)
MSPDFATRDRRTTGGSFEEDVMVQKDGSHEVSTGDDSLRDADGERRLTLSEEELAVDKRRVPAGEVRLSKSVETEHVREDVPVTREEVVVERHSVRSGIRADGVDLGEDEITVPVTAEEVVAKKRAVVKEEIVARKHEVEENRTVEADLRREHVEIDDQTRTKKLKGSKSKSGSRSKKRDNERGRSGG